MAGNLPTYSGSNSFSSIAKAEAIRPQVFDNQFPIMKATEFCKRFGFSMKTIYEWKYRPKRNKVPDNLVVKFRGKLFIRTDILESLTPFLRESKDPAGNGDESHAKT